ncbi:galactose oxidase early set domain-containing protein [Arthrobacter sp. RIT-PI-e]|uniref:galactose oxidase early set domain-containing protein n=1 Tax=Arthrobacter sp. RIT-PI-e TaxID=1681197 RepID=UPI00067637CC|nr:galactose oxidase early set domain-containing protein [Arthrobacter sp. RIT-PI-e]
MRRRRPRIAAALIAVGFVTTALVALPSAAQAALPTGTLTAPASNATFTAGQAMQLSATVKDTPGPSGPTAGVRQVEWWLYADKTKGAPTDFSDQYPNNVDDMINIGVSTVPASGTAADGTFQARFTVPANGTIAVGGDGDQPPRLPDGPPRQYALPSGTYRVQAHTHDDEWRTDFGTPGLTGFTTITLNTGAAPQPTPVPSPTPTSSPSPSASPAPQPTPTPSASPSAQPSPQTTPTATPTTATNLVANGNHTTGANLPACWVDGSWGVHNRTAALSTTDVPAGSPAGTRSFAYTVTGYQSGDAKIMASDAAGCAPTVDPAAKYTLGVQYKSTVATNAIPLFTATSTGGWEYWTTLRPRPAATGWTSVSAELPALPAGTTRVSFGMAAVGNGTVMSTGWTLRPTTNTTTPPTTPPTTTPAPADPRATTGEWQIASVTLPNRGIHQTLLRDGRVLVIAGSGNDEANFDAGSFTTHVWNPTTGAMIQVPTPEDMFCAGHVTLPDGRILIQGGTKEWWTPISGFKGLRSSYIFDPATNQFTRTNDANEGHWYPTLTKLENGNVWMGGGLTDEAGGYGAHTTEMFNTPTSSWLPTAQVPQTWSYWGEYPHMFLLGDGRLFYTGAHTFGDQRPGSGSSLYNWRTAQIADVQGLRDKDLRDHAGSVLLPPAQNQRFMIAGGGYIDRGAAPTNSVDIIDMNEATPSWKPGPALPGPGRQYLNLTNMFDRTVLASNGATGNRTGNISAASIYTPSTNAWITVPADPVGRNYHSMNMLLPDGRVMILGSNPIDGSVEMRVSIYNPPYLFKGTRPTVTSAPATAKYGQSINLGVTGTVASASLTSPMSSTHQMDTNTRLVDLPITGTGATRTAAVPSNAALLPPGPYMLTVLDEKGAVSVARWITIGR